MNQMTTITSDEATRREIAERYGIALDLVAPVTVVPRGVSGLPMPWEDQASWKAQRDAKRRIEKRIDRLAGAKSAVNDRIAARRAQAVEMHDAGAYAHQIAEALGVAVTTAEDDLRKSGRKPHRMPYVYTRPTALVQRDARIKAMHASGAHIGMIAEAEGCDVRAARKYCAQAGVKPQPVPRAPKPPKEANRQHRIRAERATLIATMVAEGRSREAIIAASGLTDEGVRRACLRLGLQAPDKADGRTAEAMAARNERIAKVRALPSTLTYEQAGKALGVTRLKAAALAREAGVKFVRTYVRPQQVDAEMIERIATVKRMWRDGMGFTAIQTELGLTVPKLRYVMEKAGIYKARKK